MRTLIIGAGQAGRRTAELLRGLDAEREILLLGEETEPPYDRPPLSKEILLGEERPRGLMQRDAKAYADQRIALRLGERVARVDLKSSRVETEAGLHIPYDSLVIATGARARSLLVPGANDPRILTLRSMADARALRAQLRPGLRLAVAGAGLIGLEVAAAAIQCDCMVTVIEMGERAMARCVPKEVSDQIEGWHRAAGVALEFGCRLAVVNPEKDALRLATSRGEFEADLLLVAVGAVPNSELAYEAGLAVDDGILVDASGRSSHPTVFAAGEVARIRQSCGRHVRFETWQVAQHQPSAVASALCGIDKPYSELPWHWTDQYKHNVQILGAHDAGLEWLCREDGGRLAYLGVDSEGRVRGAILIDNGRETTPVKRIIASGTAMSRGVLRDPATPLRQLC
ncbi:NAD(P)/FAD-dependent oxidoreductase [Sabulicella glaciei]|uniref:FAD-dependent oxidoreductase n=1 Tax=Sabulicella glaciei TaxID=2984948 RepID=A0ABT3NZH7_9PROT|nr:FAD-dependent oxidoreductase [Roseococcus sp. MDT2-1-1]MCW8087554.1 FAD-dependent oxidoreductase [Roseococcus sp. MDT2-1-1]